MRGLSRNCTVSTEKNKIGMIPKDRDTSCIAADPVRREGEQIHKLVRHYESVPA